LIGRSRRMMKTGCIDQNFEAQLLSILSTLLFMHADSRGFDEAEERGFVSLKVQFGPIRNRNVRRLVS
jgi:hypothetical protein